MSFFKRKRYPFEVDLFLSGRHPYLESHELDYENRVITVAVQARDWNHAERQAWVEARKHAPWWKCWVLAISRVSENA